MVDCPTRSRAGLSSGSGSGPAAAARCACFARSVGGCGDTSGRRRRIGPHRIAPPTPVRVASLKSPRHGRFRSYSSRLNGMRVIGRCRKRSLFSLATLEMGWRPGRISTLRHSQQPHRLLLPPTRCLDGSFSEFPWVSTHDSLRVPGLGPRSGHTRCELIAHSSPFAACGCSYSLLGWGSRNAALFSYASTKRVFRGTDTGTLSKHRA